MLHGRTLVSYKADFDRGVFEWELARHNGAPAAADRWRGRIQWEDAMASYVVWRGLCSVKRGAYRNQSFGGPHDAVAECKLLLAKLEQMGAAVPVPRW